MNCLVYFRMNSGESHFSLNRTTGWLSLRRPPSTPSSFRVGVTAHDLGKSMSLASKELNLFVNFFDDEYTNEYHLDISLSLLQTNLKIFNLKRYFPSIFKYLTLSSKLLDLVEYNSSNGDVIFVNKTIELNQTSYVVDVKIISSKSDLNIASLILNVVDNAEMNKQHRQMKKMNSFDILVSTRTAGDTVIFKLAQDLSLEFADDDDSATMQDHSNMFYIQSSMILLKRNLTLLRPFTDTVRIIKIINIKFPLIDSPKKVKITHKIFLNFTKYYAVM